MNSLLKAVAKMIVGLAVTAGCLYLVLQANNVLVSLLWVFIMIVMGALVATRLSRQKASVVLFPLIVGSAIAVFVFGLWFIFLVMGIKNPFETRWLIPVCGLLAGAVSLSCGQALRAYYAGLHAHHQLYDFLLGNGATHAEATLHFLRRAMQACMIPLLKMMGVLVVPLSASMFWILIMTGTDAVQAALFQALLLITMLAAAVTALFISIVIGRHYAFDKYSQLKK